MRRSHTLSAKEVKDGLDPDDRKNAGYITFYNTILAILQEKRASGSDEFKAYQDMTKGWIKETR